MELIRNLEEKFAKLETKLDSLPTKRELINNAHLKQNSKIHKLFDLGKQKKV